MADILWFKFQALLFTSCKKLRGYLDCIQLQNRDFAELLRELNGMYILKGLISSVSSILKNFSRTY